MENENILEKIRPSNKERIISRMRRVTFCRAIIWVTIQLKKYGVAHSSGLARFLKTDVSHAYRILKSLEELGLVKSKAIGNFIEFLPIYKTNSKKTMAIEDYFEEAKEKLRRRGFL